LPDESGFVTANGTPCSWSRLNELVTPLNVRTRLNVVILLATCYGGSFARSIRVSDQAPVLALIGPPAEITAGQSEVDFRNLYRAFFANNSIAEALAALDRNGTRYFGTTARGFFLSVWRDYRINHCSDDRLRERARELALRARAQGLPRKSIGQFRAGA
jgi:hypothetical protein